MQIDHPLHTLLHLPQKHLGIHHIGDPMVLPHPTDPHLLHKPPQMARRMQAILLIQTLKQQSEMLKEEPNLLL